MDKIILEFLKYGVLGLFLLVFSWVIKYLYFRVKELGNEKEAVIKEILDKKGNEIRILNEKIELLLRTATEREKEIAEDRAEDMEKLINIINQNTNVIQSFDHAIREFYRQANKS